MYNKAQMTFLSVAGVSLGERDDQPYQVPAPTSKRLAAAAQLTGSLRSSCLLGQRSLNDLLGVHSW